MLQKYLDYVQPSPSCPLYPLPFLIHILTVSFLGSRSRSRRSREVLTFRARDRAMRPPVLISFSRRSRRSSLGLSAMNSATATAPRAHNNRRPVKNAKIQHTRTHTHQKKLQLRNKYIISYLHRTAWWKQGPAWAQSGWRSARLSACGLLRYPLNYGRGSESPDSVCMAERNNI